MTDKTSKHIGKSIIAGFAYNLVVPNPFPYDEPKIIIANVTVSIMIAFAFQIIPGIFYYLYYVFTKDKEKSKKIFNVSFNIVFWIWMVFMVLGAFGPKI